MISVIVPYRDAEEWLGRCIASMQAQQAEGLEFILVNDHSKDGGKKLAKKLTKGDKRFVYLDNAREPGVSGARNTGLDMAGGEWVTFLDADDELLPGAGAVFERMARLGGNIIQANHLRHYKEPDRTVCKYANGRGVYSMEALPQCWCMVWNKLIRRAFLEEYGIRFVEGLQYGEDEIFNLDMLARDDRIIHTLPKTATVLRHFDNKQSLSRTKTHSTEGLLAQAHALEEFILRTDNAAARVTACKVLSEHWGSRTYINALGAGK